MYVKPPGGTGGGGMGGGGGSVLGNIHIAPILTVCTPALDAFRKHVW